jgi:hypothetical protein
MKTASERREMALPLRFLHGDWLRGHQSNRLQMDLPDGSYRVISLLENQPELADGSFRIEQDGTSAGTGRSISYSAGESGDKAMNVEVNGGRLTLVFIPEKGKTWLIAGLILARRRPHMGHVPVRTAEGGSRTAIRPTITAPDGPVVANLFMVVDGRRRNIPLIPEGIQYAAQLTWPKAGKNHKVGYFIQAEDALGHAARWPESGFIQVKIAGPE